MDIEKMLKRSLWNQQQILKNQALLLADVRRQYTRNKSDANRELCDSLDGAIDGAIRESKEDIKLTRDTLS